ncbi:MAG: spermidine/putrescine ABC transporter substrate-binding protein [Ruminococcaceae bacterium]|nr:spermidine/putrescine ABC transporter substrate-binding protein [Oscillospiraceae bacterium]
MKKAFSLLCALVLLCVLLPVEAEAANEVVNVYNWGQYISDGSDGYPDLNAAFEEATGIKVNYMTFDSNESMYTKLKTGGSSYDVIIPSDYMVARLIDEGMLLPLNFDNIPNYQYIDEAYRNTSYDPENLYSVPYTWGTVGVIWNSDYVDEADTGSWDILWNEKYDGKILMFDNPRDAFAVAELLLGYSLNTTDEEELRAASYKLIEQKPLVQSYVMDQIYDKMERGEAWIAPYYAGDYLMMAEDHPELQFFFPEEGYNLFIDAMCIPTCAENKEAAEAYINFLCDPQNCGPNLEYLAYSSPETASKEYMDPAVTESEVAYPDEETLSRGESFYYLNAETTQLMDSLWLGVKTDGDVDYVPIIGISVVFLSVGSFLTARAMRNKRRKANRCKKWREQT